jgi:NAD+ kinase
MWVSTASGSTAAMKAAGGSPMENTSVQLQYKIREHLVEYGENAEEEAEQKVKVRHYYVSAED